MDGWCMATLVGRDRPGIVAAVTEALYRGGFSLGGTSMTRLGGNFTVMMLVQGGDAAAVRVALAPVAQAWGLHLHVDEVEASPHDHPQPDVRITVYGADRPGIVAQVTGALAEAGLNILDLESDVGGTREAPLYLLHLEGQALRGVAPLQAALERVREAVGVEVSLQPVEAVIG